MSKHVLWVLVLLACGVVTACQPAGGIPASSPTATPVLGTTTHTASPIAPSATASPSPSLTATLWPTQTQRPSATPSQTPSPQPTSTAYPTFDASRIITMTPAPTAVCPVETPGLQITLDLEYDGENWDMNIQKALDQGASFQQIATKSEGLFDLMDLNGDGVAELVAQELFSWTAWGCHGGTGKIILEYGGDAVIFPPRIIRVDDNNRNGIPEVFTTYIATTGWITVMDILEWNGDQFVSIIQASHGEEGMPESRLAQGLTWYGDSHYRGSVPDMNSWARIYWRDLEGDYIQEVILHDYGPAHPALYWEGWPWRGKLVVFRWDGLHYLYSELIMDPPEFRFQAVQEADRLFLLGQYDQALALYRQAIFARGLRAWGLQMKQCILDQYYYLTVSECSPSPDPDEYPALAAYARYRIMLHHLVRGWRKDAQIVYDALLQKYPQGSPGYPYAEMARLVWDATTAGGEIETACARAVAYASDHPEILAVLGDTNHGDQSHEYVAADVCPFP